MMASSNQEGHTEPKPPQLATHNSNTYGTDHASPSSVYPSHVLGEGIPTWKDPNNEHEPCYTATGYPTFVNKDYNPHVYPQGHAVYVDGCPAGHQTVRPVMAPYYGPPPTHHHITCKDKMLRFFIVCCCVFLAAFLFSSIFMDIYKKPQLPIYKVKSMSVANFSITPSISGKWDITIIVENPSDDSTASFYHLKVSPMYKGDPLVVNHDNEDSFTLFGKEDQEIQVKDWSDYADHDVIVMDEMVKEQSSGAITFDLKVSSAAMLKTNLFSSTNMAIVGTCTGLKVVFQSNNNATNGAWDNGGKPMECTLL